MVLMCKGNNARKRGNVPTAQVDVWIATTVEEPLQPFRRVVHGQEVPEHSRRFIGRFRIRHRRRGGRGGAGRDNARVGVRFR